jgi:hypothetical protein
VPQKKPACRQTGIFAAILHANAGCNKANFLIAGIYLLKNWGLKEIVKTIKCGIDEK